MDYLNHLENNKKVFFNYMNENYTIFQHSNIFFRDIQFALISYFEIKEKPIKYGAAGKLATEFINNLVLSNELSPIDHKSWKVNFEVGIKKVTEEEKQGDNDE
ncbi:MAG: hypothetical protein GY936_01025 [Ignavibacteriae bacterium]|nr:hypothetical protein [Ignavibacteriota bacterium]